MARIPSFNTAAFFFSWRNFANWQQKKPSETSRKELKKELPEHSPYFLEKKEKKRKNLPD